ncbi:hypothetical protein YDYSY3_39680 [Paenibacillus chitinolyticus]|uniref:ParM/StbA family protein n=1 Tax=Paenibacillus chitinolyticus TaxID=79263 RepID=UPI0026E505A6|nr:ParM/StbA family protein [Paenibacillus chitinolyticus]GKS12968.1 hypothetical protein YDYSY3_39680 [Paenibacillus chitinolyticus]
MKFSFPVGNDIGNSEHDIYVDGVLIRQPNVFSQIGQLPWSDDEIDVQKNLASIYDNLVVSIVSPAVPTGLYTVGKHALKTNGENVTTLYVKGNTPKSDQLGPYITTLAAIAGRAVEKAFKSGADVGEIQVTADMASDLPVKQHNPNNTIYMRNKFMGEKHNVTVHLGLTKKVDVRITFDFVQILQEGTPAIFALQMDSQGNWRKDKYDDALVDEDEVVEPVSLFKEFSDTYELGDIDGSYLEGKNILHLDLGDGTADSPFTRGDAVDKDFCEGRNYGIAHAIDHAIPDLMTLAPSAFNSLSRQQYSEILKTQFSSGRKHKFLNEALQAFNPHCANQVSQVVKLANDQILNIGANEIDIIAVYGGGSILMKNQLYSQLKKLADATRIQLFYVPADYAVTLNAEGLDYFVRSEIYVAIKAAYMAAKKKQKKDNAVAALD